MLKSRSGRIRSDFLMTTVARSFPPELQKAVEDQIEFTMKNLAKQIEGSTGFKTWQSTKDGEGIATSTF
ncbi:hypothetical protein NPIL_60451 [Nephila pilipes]|uniref:Uncharacterized protein n=1 Tax=Nephila pilipes TaxID=299642 RepID=A0A8X6MG51_NEPPI|nr:hypothetical protein NPIL_60451 [Nephila pilipes]